MSGSFLRVNGTNVVKGAARLVISDVGNDGPGFPEEIEDVIDLTTPETIYDPQEDWRDLGATTGGIIITRGFETEGYTVDQVQGDLGEDVTGWTNTIETSLAETTPENFQLAWLGSDVESGSAANERVIHFGDPEFIPQYQMAALFQDRHQLIRMYAFRLVQRAGDDSALTHEKGGDPLSLPVLFRAFPDTTVSDRDSRVFSIFQQVEDES